MMRSKLPGHHRGRGKLSWGARRAYQGRQGSPSPGHQAPDPWVGIRIRPREPED